MTTENQFVEPNLSDGLASEALPSLVDLAEDPGGALPAGWYKAEIIEGYATRKGTQFLTQDEVSKKGDSRNLTICYKLTPKTGEPRNLFERVNYRPGDFTPERIAFVKEARDEFKGVKGKWSDSDAQRSSLALAVLGQIEKSVGFGFKRNSNGALNPSGLIGQKVDIRIKVDENGYNEVSGHAPAGEKTGK